MDYGRALLTVRVKRNLTQRDLAEIAGITASYVAHIEKGRRKPTLDVLEKIAKATRVSVFWITVLATSEEDLEGCSAGYRETFKKLRAEVEGRIEAESA